MKSAVVVSNAKEVFQAIHSSFGADAKVDAASTEDAALGLLRKEPYDLLFIDITMLHEFSRGAGYRAALEPFFGLRPAIEVVVMASRKMINEAVDAVKAGARDYLAYPIDPEAVKYLAGNIRESVMLEAELDYLRGEFWESDWLETIQTKNPVMQEVYKKVRSVAPTRSTVLLMGETGTGKGVLANLIHRHSNRRNAQFISLHCGAIPDTLVESELFGHEKGAFTGAVKRKIGKFEIANSGTIFLDEVGTITPPAQIKLLQILQDGTFQRLGGEETLKADVRVIAATNSDLNDMCSQGRFRTDLYYRLNVFPIEIPPLRERAEDIPHLVSIFLKRMEALNRKGIRDLAPHIMEALMQYPWPGNIREVENIIERAYILEQSSSLSSDSFPTDLLQCQTPAARRPINPSLTLAEVRRRGIEDIERDYLRAVLTQRKGRIRDSAEAAGITTRQLHKLMAKYKIRKEEFKARADKTVGGNRPDP